MRIPEILMLFLILTVAFIAVKERLCNKTGWYIAIGMLFLLWLVAVIWNTIIGRKQITDFSVSYLIPFYSYYVVLTGGEQELLRSNLMNIILFYPAGLFGYGMLPKCWKRKWRIVVMTAFCALLSISIEVCQYYFALGRAETDDVLHNTLGAFIGVLVCSLQIRNRRS